VVTCGYHGWLDWCQDAAGVPKSTVSLRRQIKFNDVPGLQAAFNGPDRIAAVVIEPVIEEMASKAWLQELRRQTTASGAILIFDEIKTAFRVAVGGVAERLGVTPDLTVLGKALGNGLPIAAVCGHADVMGAATRTWISSTLSTEFVSLAAARAVMRAYAEERVVDRIGSAGRRFLAGLERLAARFTGVVTGVRGIPEMCYLTFADERVSSAVAVACAARGLLFKRAAYNFMSLAHTDEMVDDVVGRLESALEAVSRTC
jgi:glutamate-1-semialdehyde aminotransferase